MGVTLTDLALLVLAILLPPAAVFLIKEKLDRDFVISVLLTILGWLPGQIHAIYVLVTASKGHSPLDENLV